MLFAYVWLFFSWNHLSEYESLHRFHERERAYVQGERQSGGGREGEGGAGVVRVCSVC